MKRINVFLIIAAVFALLGLFTACEQPAAVKNVTVTFVDPLNQVNPSPITVEQGKNLGGSFPEDIPDAQVGDVKYYFYGWFDGFTEYDRTTPVGADVTLTARWSVEAPEYVSVSFLFTQQSGGSVIQPTAAIPDVRVIKGRRLGISQIPATPRSEGWKFDAWLDGSVQFDLNTPLNANKSLNASWIAAETWTVTFDSGAGGAPVAPITVYKGECIDEWRVKFPPPFAKGSNTAKPEAFFVAWLDEENREYDGRTVINRDIELTARWGLPPYIVDFEKDVSEVVSSTDAQYGNVDYEAKVRGAWDNPAKKVIVNDVTYDSPYNTNRWRILYRIKMSMGSFNVNFYTRYTIRARFYANKQGGPKPPDSTSFTPNKPAKGSGYNKDGLLIGVNSPSDDGWGQISWTKEANWNGQGADADTMLQRYNLDRKGGTINDTWAPLNGKTLNYPPYLLIQTSDSYIGHIEVTQIVFHNGEKKYTMYEDEEGYDEADDGLGD